MTSKDDQDEELLARYRRAGDTEAAAPSESVRSAILAESRRVADELKKTQLPFDVSRPAANDSRWKITAYGTVGAALLAALLFGPRFWESRRAAEVSSAPATPVAQIAAPATTTSSDAAAPAAKIASANAAAPAANSEPSDAAAVPAPKMTSIAPSRPRESLQEIVVTQAERKAQNYTQAPLSMNADRAARTSFVPAPASLQAAAGLGDTRQTALLLDQGVAVDARDEAGRTPLMLAVVQGRLEVVRLLLARGADPNAADNAGSTPLQQAREKNLRDVAALLERAGAH